MLNKILQITTVTTATFLLLNLGTTLANAAEPEAAKQLIQVEKKELRISDDGNAIVDQNGREVARFANGIQMKQTGGTNLKLQGCMCCTPECIAYDQNGKCIKTYSSCTWDFDCSCK
ncbi:hypothetical protein Geob_1326 [Geotalea daltonii FRC-32]|uniref:Uncharacterized protein n=1 Tax=Geotalea daltonii (strain DSM 22248 / JCM 15807 / FRC-32) TaxID=316067 RepID=B9M4G0_GEODF|nr:hypothetical protein [Geotalea daltonii]ACM19686.1 hypothetical protein Geob_1326 [Geotalea daltonii FRC-32]